MSALGNRNSDVLRLVLIEGALMGIVGAMLGLLFGWAAASVLSALGIPMPPPPNSNLEYVARIRLSPGVLISAVAIGALATVIASVIPAIRVARIPVADALRRLV
jgi:putative ABC transport system permease protein